jgi:hypothetical protein
LQKLTIVPSEDVVGGDDLMSGGEHSLALVAWEYPEWSVPNITVVTVLGTVLGTLKVHV